MRDSEQSARADACTPRFQTPQRVLSLPSREPHTPVPSFLSSAISSLSLPLHRVERAKNDHTIRQDLPWSIPRSWK